MKTKKKWLASLLAIIMVWTMVPSEAFAAEPDSSGTIEPITEVGTVNGNDITVAGASLNWYEKDTSIGRYQDGWWVGVKIIAPATVTSDNVGDVAYWNDGTDTPAKNFGQNKTADGKYYMDCWLPVTPESLENALANDTVLKWTYKFDWTGDGVVYQTFTVTVDPNNIILKKDSGVYCKTVDGIMVVKGEETYTVTVRNAQDAIYYVVAALYQGEQMCVCDVKTTSSGNASLSLPVSGSDEYIKVFLLDSNWCPVAEAVQLDSSDAFAYTVTVAVNEETYGSVSQTSVSNVPYGTALTVDGNKLTVNGTEITATANEGYKFAGWSIGTATVTGNITVTANFAAVESVVVTFDPNDGSSSSMEVQTFTKDVPENLTACTLEPDKYYDFLGWNTKADGSGTDYADQASFPADASTTLYAQWAVDGLRKAVDDGVTGVSGKTAALNTNMQTVAGSANLNRLMTRTANLASKLASYTETSMDEELVNYVEGVDWENVALAENWISATADSNDNDAHVGVTVGGKVVLLTAAGVPYAVLQNAGSYSAEELLASMVGLTKDVWQDILYPQVEQFKGISDSFTVTYAPETGDTITVTFNDVDALYTELRPELNALNSAATQEEVKALSNEIVQILKNHIAVPTGQTSMKELLKLTYAVAQDMLEQAAYQGRVDAKLTITFDVLSTYQYADKYADGTFQNTYTLDLAGDCQTDYNQAAYEAMLAVKKKIVSYIDQVQADGDVIYSGGSDVLGALVDNFDKVKDGMDVYVTLPVPEKLQDTYDKFITGVVADVKDQLTTAVDGKIEHVDIAGTISDRMKDLPITNTILEELNDQLAAHGLAEISKEPTLEEIGFNTDAFAAAIKADIMRWWSVEKANFVDDVLTGEDVYDLKNDEILSNSLGRLQNYFEGSGSSTRQYLETVKTGVEGYVEQQLRSAITSKVKSGVTDLNSQIATINEMLASAESSFAAANEKIAEANDQISELNDTIRTTAEEDEFETPELPAELSLITAPMNWAWSIDTITADVNADWTWTETKDVITDISTVIGKLNGLVDGIDSFGTQKDALTDQIAKNQEIIDSLRVNGWPVPGTLELPDLDDFTVPALTEKQTDAVTDGNTMVSKLGDVDTAVEKANTEAGAAFENAVSTGALRPEALGMFVARAIQEELNDNETYLAIEYLLPLTGKTGSLELKNVTIDTISKFKTAAGVSLDTLIQNNLPGRDVVGGLHRAAAALEKLPAGATIYVTVEGKALFTGGTINADTLATALNGSSVDAIYDNLCGLLTSDAKTLSMGAFAKPVGENNYQAVTVTVTGGAYDYPLTVYLQMTNI